MIITDEYHGYMKISYPNGIADIDWIAWNFLENPHEQTGSNMV